MNMNTGLTRKSKKQKRTNDIAIASVKASRQSNTIAWIALYINCFIFMATLGVFIYNIKGVNAAVDAANAAIRADSISISALKWDSIKNAQASIDDSIKSKKQFDLAKKSLDEQIQSVKAAQKNFEMDNEPYLPLQIEIQ